MRVLQVVFIAMFVCVLVATLEPSQTATPITELYVLGKPDLISGADGILLRDARCLIVMNDKSVTAVNLLNYNSSTHTHIRAR